MNGWPRRRTLAAAATAVLALAGPGLAQGMGIDALLARIYIEPNPQPYTMSADFSAEFTLTTPTGRYLVNAVGTFLESRSVQGEPRRRRATISRLDVPVMLRPFTGAIRKIITDLIEVEQRPAEVLPTHDVFIAEERLPDRYLLGGVRADIVTDTMTRAGLAGMLRDVPTRRAIAKWLWSPVKRGTIARSGPGAYLLTAVVDDAGLMHQLTLNYDWGQVGNRITFVTLGGRPFWREVTSDTASEVAGLGRVDGRMVLLVTNHCLNCTPR